MGRAGSPWPEGWPGPTLKSPGPGPDTRRTGPSNEGQGQLGFQGPGQGRTGTYDKSSTQLNRESLSNYFCILHYFLIESHCDCDQARRHHHHHHNHESQPGPIRARPDEGEVTTATQANVGQRKLTAAAGGGSRRDTS